MSVIRIQRARHGRGLFATRHIAAGESILRMRGPRITYAQVLRKRTPDNAFQISRNRYIDLRSPGVIGNHSCNPNAGVTPNLELVAIKPIRQGQEIRYDYSACMDKDTSCDFRCGCAHASCRRTICGFATLPPSTRRRYRLLGIVQPFLLRERNT